MYNNSLKSDKPYVSDVDFLERQDMGLMQEKSYHNNTNQQLKYIFILLLGHIKQLLLEDSCTCNSEIKKSQFKVK